jgi:hypothetical protein
LRGIDCRGRIWRGYCGLIRNSRLKLAGVYPSGLKALAQFNNWVHFYDAQAVCSTLRVFTIPLFAPHWRITVIGRVFIVQMGKTGKAQPNGGGAFLGLDMCVQSRCSSAMLPPNTKRGLVPPQIITKRQLARIVIVEVLVTTGNPASSMRTCTARSLPSLKCSPCTYPSLIPSQVR